MDKYLVYIVCVTRDRNNRHLIDPSHCYKNSQQDQFPPSKPRPNHGTEADN